MIWVDREVKNIKERNLPLEWVDDMKTPSGRIHVGALRGVVIHDLVYKALQENKVNSKYTYIFDDHDPMDDIPAYLDYNKWEKYAGKQLYQIPSPKPGYKSYAHYWAQEFIEVFNSINCHPQIIWGSELYNSGKMNKVIKEILDAAIKIREIYQKVAKVTKPSDWYPFNVRCEKCGRIRTTQVYRWDGNYVYYRCLPQLVKWAKGCGHQGKISPYNGNGKLPWKIEWAAKWKVVGVTIEGAGKDHMSKGGSHDIASTICQEVLNYPVPYPLPYEWFTVGGRKMSSSKGIGSSAKEISTILPPAILRFLMVRKPINQHLDFDPYGETIPKLFDDFDQCLNAYFDKLENKISQGKAGEVALDFARIVGLSAVNQLPKKRLFQPRFRTIIQLLLQKQKNIITFFENQKKEKLTKEEKNILEERLRYAKIYLTKYYQETHPGEKFTLSNREKNFLKKLAENLQQIDNKNTLNIQQAIIKTINQENLDKKNAFQSLYFTLTGKLFGPKAGDLISQMGLKKVIEKLKSV